MIFDTFAQQDADSVACLIPHAIFEAFFKMELTDQQRVMMTGSFEEIRALPNLSVTDSILYAPRMVCLYCLTQRSSALTSEQLAILYEKFDIDKRIQLLAAIAIGNIEKINELLGANSLDIIPTTYTDKRQLIEDLYMVAARSGELNILWQLMGFYPPKDKKTDFFYDRAIITALERNDSGLEVLANIISYIKTRTKKPTIEMNFYYLWYALTELKNTAGLRLLFRHMDTAKLLAENGAILFAAIQHTDLFTDLFEILSSDLKSAFVKNDYLDYLKEICSIGDTRLFTFLWNLDSGLFTSCGLDKAMVQQSVLRANNYELFRLAAEAGNTEIMTTMLDSASSDIVSMLRSSAHDRDSFDAFYIAIGKDRLDMLNLLLSRIPAANRIDFLNRMGHKLLCNAAKGGQLAIVARIFSYLRETPDGETMLQNIIAAYNYEVFASAAHSGKVEVLESILSAVPDGILPMLRANHYRAFYYAACAGHVDVIEWLVKKAGGKEAKEALDMISAKTPSGYSAYTTTKYSAYAAVIMAGETGHVDVMNTIFNYLPDADIPIILERDNFALIRNAISYGRAAVVRRLIGLAPNKILDALQCRSGLIEEASRYPAVFNELLSLAEVLAFAEVQDRYRPLVRNYINTTLDSLRTQRTAFAAEHPGDVFTIPDRAALNCFYMIRHLIGLNEPAQRANIEFLLSIPAVQILAHQDLLDGPANELLKLAMKINNRTAARILLAIPAVSDLASAEGIEGLAALMNDEGSSVAPLTTRLGLFADPDPGAGAGAGAADAAPPAGDDVENNATPSMSTRTPSGGSAD